MRRSGLICLARSSRTGLDMSHILFMVEIRSEERRVGKEGRSSWSAELRKREKCRDRCEHRAFKNGTVRVSCGWRGSKDSAGCLFFKQKTAYEIGLGIPAEPLFRSPFAIN